MTNVKLSRKEIMNVCLKTTRGCTGFDMSGGFAGRSALAALTATRLFLNGKTQKTTEEAAKDSFFMSAYSNNNLAFA